jgi:hypothetical protein
MRPEIKTWVCGKYSLVWAHGWPLGFVAVTIPASIAADIIIVMSEMDFIIALQDRTGCSLLLN